MSARPDVFFCGFASHPSYKAAESYALSRGLDIIETKKRYIKGTNCFFLLTKQKLLNTSNFFKMSKIKICLSFSDDNVALDVHEGEMLGIYTDGAGVETVIFYRKGAVGCEHLPIEHIQEFLFDNKWIKANFSL